MWKYFMLLGFIALVGGCANVNLDPNVATPSQQVVAINAYNVAVATARAYLKLPLCGGAATLCRTQALSQSVYSSLVAGRAAEKQILTALKANQTAPLTAIQALQAAYAVLTSLPKMN